MTHWELNLPNGTRNILVFPPSSHFQAEATPLFPHFHIRSPTRNGEYVTLRHRDQTRFCWNSRPQLKVPEGRRSSPGGLELHVVLRDESLLSVQLSFVPVVLQAQNLDQNKEPRGQCRGQRSGGQPVSALTFRMSPFLKLSPSSSVASKSYFPRASIGKIQIWADEDLRTQTSKMKLREIKDSRDPRPQ